MSIEQDDEGQADKTEGGMREVVLETLLQLHLDFAALGRLDEAGPLLHKLMTLAYHAQPAPAGTPVRERPAKCDLN